MITLILKSVFIVIAVLDGLIIGGLCYWIIEKILGEKPVSGIVKRIIGIPAGLSYPIIIFSLLDDSSLDFNLSFLIFAAPVIIYILYWSSKKTGS